SLISSALTTRPVVPCGTAGRGTSERTARPSLFSASCFVNRCRCIPVSLLNGPSLFQQCCDSLSQFFSLTQLWHERLRPGAEDTRFDGSAHLGCVKDNRRGSVKFADLVAQLLTGSVREPLINEVEVKVGARCQPQPFGHWPDSRHLPAVPSEPVGEQVAGVLMV